MGDTRGLQTLASADIPYIPIDDEKTALAVVRELARNRTKCVYDDKEYTTVFLDSISATGQSWLEGFMAFKKWDMLWDGEGGKDPRQAYSYAAERGRQITKALFDIRAHVVILAREMTLEEGEGKSKVQFSAPELPGQKLGRELPGWPDATLRGDFVNGKRVLRTKTYARAVAGIRAPFEVPEFILPDTALICQLVTGDKSVLPKLAVK